MNIQANDKVGQLVASDYRLANVFRQYQLDFCCQGNKTLQTACEEKGIDVEQVLLDLQNTLNLKENSTVDFRTWPLDLLVDYIEKKHHSYVQEKSTEISAYVSKIVDVNGKQHPELREIQSLFEATKNELAQHMKKEENILFPYIKMMVQAQVGHVSPSLPHFGTVQNPIAMMMHEHDTEGDRFRKIAQLTNNYVAPTDACNTYKVTYGLLQEFEQDLHLHIHLENNILFPNAIKLEAQCQSSL